jgi:hypothetical protein
MKELLFDLFRLFFLGKLYKRRLISFKSDGVLYSIKSTEEAYYYPLLKEIRYYSQASDKNIKKGSKQYLLRVFPIHTVTVMQDYNHTKGKKL